MPTERISPDLIQVKYDRIREDMGDLTALKASLQKFGQLQPILVEDDLSLIDGGRRLAALRELGMDAEIIRRSDVTEIESREIELEANLQRQDMTWQEKAKGLAELDRLKRLTNPGWNQASTAQVANIKGGQREVSDSLLLTKMMDLFPEVAEAKNKAQALNIAKRKAKQLLDRHEVATSVDIYTEIEDRLWLGDSVERIMEVPSESFHAIITDPPFGVDYNERVAGTANTADAYEDSAGSYRRILGIAPDLYRVLRPDGWLIWFCGISWYEEAKHTFRSAGFTVDEIPIIWDRSDGRTFTTRPDRWFPRAYDIALHCLKGNPQLPVRNRHNIIRVPPVGQSERELTVERPVELYRELIERVTIPGQTVADFFAGSGSCLAAAAMSGRRYFGCELDPDRRAHAIKKIHAHTPVKDPT